jgi:hypothetical protein
LECFVQAYEQNIFLRKKMKMNNTLLKPFKLSRIIETFENYEKLNLREGEDTHVQNKSRTITNERDFWMELFAEPERYWNHNFIIPEGSLSFWIPRIPGLYFSRGAKLLREMGLTYQTNGSKFFEVANELEPLGKSGVVLGGVGTILLPPDSHGNQLGTVTPSNNVSCGIPILLATNVLERTNIREGDKVQIKSAKFVKMSLEWADRFPSIRGIKRGYLLVDHIDQVKIIGRVRELLIQPCSIMEYETEAALLYDYVFVTVNSTDKRHRRSIIDFYEYYRTKDSRNGKYMIAADVADPLLDSVYTSPDKMRSDHAGLNLIKHRIRKTMVSGTTIQDILDFLASNYHTHSDIRLIITHVRLPEKLMNANRTADMHHEIVDYCLQHSKMEELIDFLNLNK